MRIALFIDHLLLGTFCEVNGVYKWRIRRLVWKIIPFIFSKRILSIYTIWYPYFFGIISAWKIFILFTLNVLVCIKAVPERRFYNVPLAFIFASALLKGFTPTLIYDNFAGMVGALNTFSSVLWFFFYMKEKWALTLFLCGASCLFINFLVDRQRQYTKDKNGHCLVWSKKPDLIFANYRREWREGKQNLLLVSSWWGISPHFHYIPELLGAVFWSLLALFDHFLPYFYLWFLTFLWIDRAYRHERRCAIKCGKGWEKYYEKVTFRIIPFIY